jgi:hypothetical protein
MTKKQVNILVFSLLAIFAIGLTIFFIYDHQKKKKLVKNVSGNPNATVTNGQYTDTIDVNKVLRKGDSGNSVKVLQSTINDKIKELGLTNVSTLVPDGIFGSATETAVQALVIGRFSSEKGNITIAAVRSLIPLMMGSSTTYTGSRITDIPIF